MASASEFASPSQSLSVPSFAQFSGAPGWMAAEPSLQSVLSVTLPAIGAQPMVAVPAPKVSESPST